MEKKKIICLLLSGIFLLMACTKEESAEQTPSAYLEIRFHPSYNNSPLQLNTPLSNTYGEEFTLSVLKFYTGQYSLADVLSGTAEMAGGEPYNLSDYSDPATLSITRSIKPGTYDELSFLIGVDSARNVSGVQSGSLDPANGMFWTWNSGYIYMKLEGNSPVSTEPNGKIEYHIGGFQNPYNAIRKYTGRLTAPDKWELSAGKKISFDINFSIDRFFSVPFPIKISEIPVCTTPGELSANIADNISSAFEVTNFEIK